MVLQVLIIGAGIVGLALGQALKKNGIAFEIVERDESADSRGQGWAISIHWALVYLDKMLPPDVIDRIKRCQVDADMAAKDSGAFPFLNLEDASVKAIVPSGQRWRVNRGDVRGALMKGIEQNIRWGKQVDRVSSPEAGSDSVQVFCTDGSSYNPNVVVGVDGTNSAIRKILLPDTYSPSRLPFRSTGLKTLVKPEQIVFLQSLGPLVFQGCHPTTRTFMWFSKLDTPKTSPGNAEDPMYTVQIYLSWPFECAEDEVADTDAARLANMKSRAEPFASPLQAVIESIPDDTIVTEVKLADWECLEWDNKGGSVTLAGDAAHAMTMYRGEAANHGLLDALWLSNVLKRIDDGEDRKTAIDEYEREMRSRTQLAVRLSTQAVVDAHTWGNLSEDSAALTERMRPDWNILDDLPVR